LGYVSTDSGTGTGAFERKKTTKFQTTKNTTSIFDSYDSSFNHRKISPEKNPMIMSLNYVSKFDYHKNRGQSK